MFDHRKSRAVAASKNTINSDWPQEGRRKVQIRVSVIVQRLLCSPANGRWNRREIPKPTPSAGKKPVLSVQSTSFLSREASC